MCGRYVLFTDEEEDDITELVHEIQRNLYGEDGKGSDSQENNTGSAAAAEAPKPPLRASGEVFPTQYAPVLTASGPQAMLWGFPAYKGKGVIINARAESVYDKPMFRQAVLSRRVAVPSHGFFEWRKNGKEKEKLLFNHPGMRVLYMAGLYTQYADGARFTILTTAANDGMRPVHDRMPVILLPSETAAYLRDEKAARAILSRIPPELDCTAS